MIQDIDDLIEPIFKNEYQITNEDLDQRNGVKGYKCSTFVESESVLIKGEILEKEEFYGAMLVFFDPETGDVKGICSF